MMCKLDSPNADVEAPPLQDASRTSGFHVRWSRLVKTVQVKEATSGLLKGSIAGPANSSRKSSANSGPVNKTILDEVSGSSKPGEVLAMMGPSGASALPIVPNCFCYQLTLDLFFR